MAQLPAMGTRDFPASAAVSHKWGCLQRYLGHSENLGIDRKLFWRVLYCSRQISSSHADEDRALFLIASNSADILGKLLEKLASPVSSYFRTIQDHFKTSDC